MEIWLWAVIGIFILIVIALLVKIHLLQKSAREIEEGFADRLMTDTNTLIDISGHDKYMRSLANSVNVQLRKLREERLRFYKGDMELKNAVTNISHDLRTPLTAICGYLDLLEKEDMSGDARRYVEVIGNRTEMMAQLTEELFRYSVISATKDEMTLEETSINAVLEESIAAFYTVLAGRGMIPDIHMPEQKVIRTVDRSALSRIFSNLLNNAVRYSDGDLEITLYEDGRIIFANTASGLDEVQVGRLFDRFYTVEAARKSTGLGLAIARTLVEQMDGSITANYENNRLSICIFI